MLIVSEFDDDDRLATPLGIADPEQALDGLVDARILIVDDNRVSRSVVEINLVRAGYTNIRTADDGEQGLKTVFDWHPHLIITDMLMPKLDGFDFCRWLRAEPRFKAIPVIVQTVLDAPELRGDIFDAGATDLIVKPINGRELLSRVRVHLERRRLIDHLSDYQNRLNEELRAARDMQCQLMPAAEDIAELCRKYPIEVASMCEPSSLVSGDLWGIDQLSPTALRIWTADFTGHGIYSALNTFRLHTYLKAGNASAYDPGEWLGEVNAFLCKVLPVGQFATMLCTVIDFSAGSLAVASAAAPYPIHSEGDDFRLLPLDGLPLGILPSASYETSTFPFGSGATLFAYSDALIETPEADAPALPPEKVADFMAANRSRPLEAIRSELVERLDAAAPAGLTDDLTMILIRHLGAPQ
ncbi:Transcriptional regulatory protein AfsQ1 [Hartmannibacter diazotrophicus]|uniref:Transcriptional regulatory protein AfsQ1 n=1 Tax=Hartmannibacter diazotrophicus TaxID=1482074 RepID=A0A2C9DD67_9HYPH|nr:fused response regulator/phosphatase [Hartmannibacter diazotrophicus]SON58264.1 Transcriptional regulatory protein AfsQ1 [Hartmannibacter diazotrophicus]